jgi:predicted AlkP superfamily pyrophosphatase or phosphodiesterase
VEEILGWLDRPHAVRPRLLMLYFSEPDGAGHRFGPSAPETRAAVRHVDAMLARLVAGVAERGLAATTNWIAVSDHGMTDALPEHTIVLEELVDPRDLAEVDANVVGLIEPAPGRADALVAALDGAHPHLHVARRSEVPERLHFRAHRRIPELVVWVDPGWTLFARRPESGALRVSAGNHGYDPESREMHGIFVAAGPAFAHGVAADALDNVHLYELFAGLLGLEPAPNDGDPAATRWARAPR